MELMPRLTASLHKGSEFISTALAARTEVVATPLLEHETLRLNVFRRQTAPGSIGIWLTTAHPLIFQHQSVRNLVSPKLHPGHG